MLLLAVDSINQLAKVERQTVEVQSGPEFKSRRGQPVDDDRTASSSPILSMTARYNL